MYIRVSSEINRIALHPEMFIVSYMALLQVAIELQKSKDEERVHGSYLIGIVVEKWRMVRCGLGAMRRMTISPAPWQKYRSHLYTFDLDNDTIVDC